jgi:hypothetical protein
MHLNEGTECGLEFCTLPEDGGARGDQTRGIGVPSGILVENKERIPIDTARPLPRSYLIEMSTEPCPGDEVPIPELDHAPASQHVRIPTASRIPRKHGQPNSVNTDIGVRVILQDVILDPTGPC